MVGTRPDVQDPVEDKALELAPAIRPIDIEGGGRVRGAEYGPGNLAMRVDRDDATMIGIDLAEQLVGQSESVRDLLGTARHEGNDVVSAIAMGVYQLPRGRDRTNEPIAPDDQSGKHIALDGATMSPDLAPGDLAVVVAVDPECEIQVAQGDIPLAPKLVGMADVGPESDVCITLLVCYGNIGQKI